MRGAQANDTERQGKAGQGRARQGRARQGAQAAAALAQSRPRNPRPLALPSRLPLNEWPAAVCPPLSCRGRAAGCASWSWSSSSLASSGSEGSSGGCVRCARCIHLSRTLLRHWTRPQESARRQAAQAAPLPRVSAVSMGEQR